MNNFLFKNKFFTCNIYLKYKFDWCSPVSTKSCREEDATTPMTSLIFITNFQGLSNVWKKWLCGGSLRLAIWSTVSLASLFSSLDGAWLALHTCMQAWMCECPALWEPELVYKVPLTVATKRILRQKDLSKAKLYGKKIRREWWKFQKYFRVIQIIFFLRIRAIQLVGGGGE